MSDGGGGWDILVSNPPYISPEGYRCTTTRSVRQWEPKRALVPPPRYRPVEFSCSSGIGISIGVRRDRDSDESVGDRFYPEILHVAQQTGPKVVAMEVGDMEQAERVVGFLRMGEEWSTPQWERFEIWRDEVSMVDDDGVEEMRIVGGNEVLVRGKGEGRVVVGWRSSSGLEEVPW